MKLTIALVGNPNCGKTTLFNALTGARQTVGNWPGVTVERKSGHYRFGEQSVEVVDLPGVYALDAIPGATSLDQKVAHDFALSATPDLIVNIVDAANLERNLYLTTQLLELGRPMIVALNMVDAAAAKGVTVDEDALSQRLGCPVVAMSAAMGRGVTELKRRIAEGPVAASQVQVRYQDVVEQAVAQLTGRFTPQNEVLTPRWMALKLLEGDEAALRGVDAGTIELARSLRERAEAAAGEELDVLAADARYRFIGEVAGAVWQRAGVLREHFSRRLDRAVLNRVLGLPIFLFVIYLMFLFTINLGGVFIDFFDLLAGALLVDGFGTLLSALGTPDWLRVLLADGAGGGVQTVATFIPVIGFLFLFLSFLEDSGYMARAAFVMDRLMRALGLPGKSFVPLIVGFGCNVPAVMATRTLEHPRDRLVTMAMTPFMSCGARLPVYALFAAAFFPVGGQNMVFALYLLGIAVAILTAFALRRTLLPGEGSPFVMELPPYQWPTLRGLLIHTWARLKGFVVKAGRIIVPMVLVLNILNSLGTDGSFGHQESQDSVLSAVGRTIAPAFTPMGLSEENWPAAVGVFTGVLAKEAVVGTLDALYSQLGADPAAGNEAEAFVLGDALVEAFASIPANLAGLAEAALDPLGIDIGDVSDAAAAAEAQEVTLGTFGAMAQLFDGPVGAFAYLLLILLYFPCVAVLGAVYREAGGRWAAFIAVWSTGLGYGASTLYYQLATFSRHPSQSLIWSVTIIGALALGLALMRRIGARTTLPGRVCETGACP
ncbi:MAG: Fe(2+) transporter permease subunit FeoB [Gammaproteobacteria bacterium]|nr:Fe(2+) transporter permease subunit FeoB [Gammaproteobacteria bacterium]